LRYDTAVFISHVAEDATDCTLLAELLEKEGYRAWYYERDSLPGQTYIEQIVTAIEGISAVLLFVSLETLKSNQVDREVVSAFQRNKPILPILKNLTHEDFQKYRPTWDHMLGATTKLVVTGTISNTIPNLIAGLNAMGIKPFSDAIQKQSSSNRINEHMISINQLAHEMKVTPHFVMRLAREILNIDLRTPAAVLRYGQADQLRMHHLTEKNKKEKPHPFCMFELCKGLILDMVYIPPGTFTMGSPNDEEGHNEDEIQHEVTLTQGFYLGRYPISQEQYEEVMQENPSYFQGAKLPVETVSWYDAVAFCEVLTSRFHKNFRLPTEAEWEYACRAGNKSAFSTGAEINSEQANFDGKFSYNGETTSTCRRQTTPIDAFPPNTFGLYDMHGNVWEWCSDWYGEYPIGAVTDPNGAASGSIRNLRGGSWFHGPADARSAQRDALDPGRRHSPYGFRVAMNVD